MSEFGRPLMGVDPIDDYQVVRMDANKRIYIHLRCMACGKGDAVYIIGGNSLCVDCGEKRR